MFSHSSLALETSKQTSVLCHVLQAVHTMQREQVRIGRTLQSFPPFQTERAPFDALRFPAHWLETALLHRDPPTALGALVAHRLPCVNLPQVRGWEAVAVPHAWRTFPLAPP
jgi:hypothetical protein